MCGLVELNELQAVRPAVGAPVGVVAAWHERRAVVLEHMAAEGSAMAAGAALSAHRKASGLMAVPAAA
ncbi:hypothetical protein GCM10022222_42440 [Amycolatopsis ultiminotia]|uniref:Uncharacterized protein n=1 Tax=Amycolatopsis ultiminotia TaxID=543629 RepID=A0ABP6WT95_9PSEU